MSPLLRSAAPLVLFAAIASLRAIVRRPARFRVVPSLASSALIALCLFVLPAILNLVAVRGLSLLTLIGLTSLIPVFCAVLEPHLNPTRSPRSGNAALFASLAGFSGVLLIFPFTLPDSGAAAIALAAGLAAPFSVALGYCLLIRCAAAGPPMLVVGIRSTLTAAIALVAIALCSGRPLSIGVVASPVALLPIAIAALFQAAAIGLLFRLARHLSATRLAAPQPISLLFAVLIEAVLLQQPISAPIAIGLLLLAAGAAALLFVHSSDEEPLHLH